MKEHACGSRRICSRKGRFPCFLKTPEQLAADEKAAKKAAEKAAKKEMKENAE